MAAKKRSVSKASARPSSRKSKPSARKAVPSTTRKAKAPAKAAARPAHARPTKTKPQGSSPIATKKPTSNAASPRNGKPLPATNPAPGITRRQLPARRADGGPVTASVGLIHGIPPYQAKSGESYMNERQLDHFRHILLAWKRELMEEVDRTVHHMQDEASNFPDPNDRATQESEFGLELRTRDRERKLLKKIDSALARIEDGSYGYCEETGEEIGLKRLEARPVATLSVEAQERRELAERQFRDREDGF